VCHETTPITAASPRHETTTFRNAWRERSARGQSVRTGSKAAVQLKQKERRTNAAPDPPLRGTRNSTGRRPHSGARSKYCIRVQESGEGLRLAVCLEAVLDARASSKLFGVTGQPITGSFSVGPSMSFCLQAAPDHVFRCGSRNSTPATLQRRRAVRYKGIRGITHCE
jgi:hypothetical protein